MILSFSLSLLLLSTTAKADWRPGLPWSELAAAIAGDLIDTTPSNYLKECAPEFEKLPGPPTFDRSNHGMVDQPSGLCLPHFFCSFKGCSPANPNDQKPGSVYDKIYTAYSVPSPTPYSQMNATILSWVEDTSNPSYNLPSKVLFPVEAKDAVAAVKFAKEHGLEISIKNSGHSYTSASSKGDTLHLNMNRYQTYATSGGVIDCSTMVDIDVGDDPSLADQPCRLALAKGKDAVIRVGGGENWGEVFSAVRKANDEQPGGYKYHAVGGAAATVSPMGWTFSGGLAGTVAGRTYGFGVDQVIQIEMVLPNGQHVKFGPTEWKEVDGYDVPMTLSVSGVCNANPTEPEENWAWGVCSEDLAINFDDLWLAVRGGGGGTWGVVLSVHLQLNEFLPYEMMIFKPWACTGTYTLTDEQKMIGDGFSSTFQIRFLLDPTSVGMTEAESNACGAPDVRGSYHCFGDGSASVVDTAWKAYLSDGRSSLEGVGIPPDFIDTALNCNVVYEEGKSGFEDTVHVVSPNTTVLSYKDYLQVITFPEGMAYPGLGFDSPIPGYMASNFLGANVLTPAKWILENLDTAVAAAPPDTGYRAFGGRAASAVSDQMDSLSNAHRAAGYMTNVPFGSYDFFLSTIFPQMYNTTDKSSFPAFLGGNHAGINTRGPLKSDWTKACPLEWTQEERDEKCVSLQECIWGTKLLKRLEDIKESIDPDYIFDCNGCVGNNRDKSATTTSPPSPSPTLETSASSWSNVVLAKIVLISFGALILLS